MPSKGEIMTVVKTKYGDIKGLKEDKTYIFKGIPYAAPPVGELRFRPPVEPKPWEGVRDCIDYGAPCLQLFKNNHESVDQILEISDEDCLYLNVKTQSLDPEAKLPVYIFIHGGGFESGGSNMPLYDGEFFADKGIVYININYRLGVFSGLSLETLNKESGSSGAYCIHDAARAVDWVYENITAFGGDSDNITLGGQSAGAFIVSVLMCMENMKGKFRRCILESGSIMSCQARNGYGYGNPKEKINFSVKFAERLGASDTPEGLSKLREIPAEDLVIKWSFDEDGNPLTIHSAPVLENLLFDGDQRPDPRIQSPHDVDLLFGFNTDEGTMFVGRRANMPYEKTIKSLFHCHWQEVLERYPDGFRDTLFDQIADIIGMKSFKACMLPYAEVLVERGCKVYGYHFDYLTTKLQNQGLGCRHIAELNMVFNKFHSGIGARNAVGKMTADYMNKAWAGFIKNGDPNSMTSDTEFDISWKPYDLEDRNTLKIRTDGITNVRLEREEEMDFFKNAY